MGFRDKLSSVGEKLSEQFPGGEDPDVNRQRDEVEGAASNDEQADVSYLEGESGEDIANAITDLRHSQRQQLAANDDFIDNHWERTQAAIEQNEELREEYGLDDENYELAAGGGEKCAHHDGNVPVDSVPVESKSSTTVSQSHGQSEGMGEEVGVSNTGIKTDHGETHQAGAQHTQHDPSKQMDYCKADPDGCKTSLNGFYRSADARYGARNKQNLEESEGFDQFREGESESQSEGDELGESEGISPDDAQEQGERRDAEVAESAEDTQSDGVTPDDAADHTEAEGADAEEAATAAETQDASHAGDDESEAVSAADAPSDAQTDSEQSESDGIGPSDTPEDGSRETSDETEGESETEGTKQTTWNSL